MDLLFGTSVIAAFIAGIAALFAPCCITVLLPSYIASVFKEKYKVFLMTFVFFLGILTVFLPIGLGASALAVVFNRYHNTIFLIGGLFLILLGLAMLTGKSLALPFAAHPTIKGYGVVSIFILGIFSAIATTCCAPVLAGVLAISVASGSVWLGSVYTLSYVLGMVVPLFFIALLLDKVNFTQKFRAIRKPISVNILSFNWQFVISELVSGIVFLSMGNYIIYLAKTGRLFTHSGYQLAINLYLANFLSSIQGFVKLIPSLVWVIVVVAAFLLLFLIAVKQFRKYVQK